MIRILFVMVIATLAMAQDDFFQPGYTIGGYGELHYNRAQNGNDDATITLDFHRFIIYYGYNWTEEWSFKSEVELEHNFVSGGNGELELEQAFVNYHSNLFGFQAGVILPSVGLLNEYHEPPLFISVERPEYNKYVIPTTWFGNGFVLYGSLSGLNMRFVLMEDMEGEGIGAGIRSGRGKGYKTTAYDWVKNISVNYTGIAGLRIAGSYTMNNAPIDNNPDSTVSFGLGEFNLKYDAKNIYAVMEYGNISYENNPSGYTSSGGYYLDLGYNVAGFVGLEGRLIPWFRYSDYNRGNDNADKHYTIQRFGLTYWPISSVVFKFDYGTHQTESADDVKTQINVGVGYNF
ncbi:MAG: hypothetical protein VX586_00715 [Candidatus Neomarinimicrobiota bacterium]|nr:hypothetical protein [Candidatus Neomarinimicrobiota bacterium]